MRRQGGAAVIVADLQTDYRITQRPVPHKGTHLLAEHLEVTT